MTKKNPWPIRSLEEIAELTVGFVGNMALEYIPTGVPFLRSLNVEYLRINKTDIKYISEEFHAKIKKSRLSPGDVVIVRTGKPGTCSVVPDWLEDANCSDLVIARCKPELEPNYLAYYVNTAASHHIDSHTVGAVQQHFNVGAARTLKVLLPPIEEQREIVKVLGSLDHKIESNRRMNETLEAMARALFKDWFVDFGPVRAKMEGREPPGLSVEVAGLFPRDLDENGTPISWSMGSVGDLVKQTGSSVQVSELIEDEPYFGLEHLPRRSIALDTWGTANEVESGKRRFPAGCILFGKLRPNFHKVGIAPIGGVCSTDILSLAPTNNDDFGIALSVLFSDDFVTYATRLADGAKMPRVNWKDLAKYPMVNPGRSVSAAFTKQLDPMISKIKSNIFENRELVRIRNLLLPKLLSGEIRVQEAEDL